MSGGVVSGRESLIRQLHIQSHAADDGCAHGDPRACIWWTQAEIDADALREAGIWLAGRRNGATGRRSTNAELHGQMIYERGNEIEYQADRAALAPQDPA